MFAFSWKLFKEEEEEKGQNWLQIPDASARENGEEKSLLVWAALTEEMRSHTIDILTDISPCG